MLDSWNVEADYFRNVARSAANGERPTVLTTQAAFEMKDALEALLAEVEEALQSAAPCTRSFVDLMHAHVAARALLESIERSCDMLESLPPIPVATPTRISMAYH